MKTKSTEEKHLMGDDTPLGEAIGYFCVTLLGGLIICVLLSGVAAKIANWLINNYGI